MIARRRAPMWDGGRTPDEVSIAAILCEEAVTRIIEPTVNRYENALLNAWWALCDEYLPAAPREIARRYFRLLENAPVGHSSAVLAVALAMVEGMRGGIEPLLPMEDLFQSVCAAGGIGGGEEALTLVEGGVGKGQFDEFRALFPDVRLEIGGPR